MAKKKMAPKTKAPAVTPGKSMPAMKGAAAKKGSMKGGKGGMAGGKAC